MTKMKVGMLTLLAVAALAVVPMANADLSWYNGISTMITDYDGSALQGGASETQGCFAQLILANGGTIHAFDENDPQGVSGGDTVVAATYSTVQGYFPNGSYAPSSTTSYDYYVRVFNTPADSSGSFTAMTIPSAATYYWEASTTTTYAGGDPAPTGTWNFTTGSGDLTTSNPISAVPEPTTLAFLGLGIVAFVVRKRVRS